MNEQDRLNSCEGCHSKRKNNICVRMHLYKNGTCPCIACLVKVMCMESCGDYRRFWTGIDATDKKFNAEAYREAYKG
jgi:hypothetical protein